MRHPNLWKVARILADRSGEPYSDCFAAVERLGWENVGVWLMRQDDENRRRQTLGDN